MSQQQIISAAQALERLREGNARFAQNLRSVESLTTNAQREALVKGQRPFAIILSCADSRVPSELVFDCGLGTLFVVRVAGNIVAPSIIGSIEFAAATFGTQLVAVVGHSHCGAVKAALDVARGVSTVPSENIADIVERVMPAVGELAREQAPEKELLARAVRTNVRMSVEQLRHGSRILEQLCRERRLFIVGGEYSLETGRVDFFDLGPLEKSPPVSSSESRN